MTLNECKIIEFPTFSDHRGSLSVVDCEIAKRILPFTPKRCFWIHSIAGNATRGEHAHRTCWEVAIPIYGSFKITLNDGKNEKTYCLNSPQKGIIIPSMVWCKLWGFEENTVCCVFASEEYNPEGYIHNYQSFLEEVKK